MKGFLKRVITGKDHSLMGESLKPFLAVFSCLYFVVVVVTRWLYTTGLLSAYRTKVPVISVGNIMAGGVGKTPLVMFIAGFLRSKHLKTVILTRGYMAGRGGSDEALMIAERLDVDVIVGPDRVAGARDVESRCAADVLILDDGFQHWALKRDLDIVAIDTTDPFGNRWLLPRGLLREPLSALRNAGLFILTRTDLGCENVPVIRRELERINPGCPVVETVHAPTGILDVQTGARATGLSYIKDHVVALCAIGAPEAFEDMLRREGASVEKLFVFDDHYVYTLEDVERVVVFCRKRNISKIVTTHKDAVKLRVFREAFQGVSLLVVEIDIRVTNGQAQFFSGIDRLFRS